MIRKTIFAFAANVATLSVAHADTLSGSDAFGSWKDDRPGITRHIQLQDLPSPTPQQSASNSAEHVDMPKDPQLQLPNGFKATMIASGINNPRAIRFAPNGDLFVADSKTNQILVYRFDKAFSQITSKAAFAKDLHQPYGIAFYPPGPNPNWVYIANSNSVVRFPYNADSLRAEGKAQQIVGNIPSAHHWTRDIAFSPDGKSMYVTVGSGSNVAEDMSSEPEGGLNNWKTDQPLGATWDTEEGRANLLTFTPEGKDRRIFATGLRNCAGLTIDPHTSEPWCVVNERDGLGDNLPFEYATHVKQGAFYGWPWFYTGDHEDGRPASKRPDLKDQVTVGDVLMQAHSAPLGIAFYDGKSFPQDYQGSAFVTMHGSWNRGVRTGYKIVRLIFKDGKPTGEYQDFVIGFVGGDDGVWGRPVGIAVAKDGSLFFSEDGTGTLWRVTYKSESASAK